MTNKIESFGNKEMLSRLRKTPRKIKIVYPKGFPKTQEILNKDGTYTIKVLKEREEEE